MSKLGMKLMIVGYARHGKDTVADLLTEHYDMHFVSSSYFMAERVVLPKMQKAWQRYRSASPIKVEKPPFPEYADLDEAYADRVNHRQFWFEAIKEANEDDPAFLSTAIFAEFDLYVGNRNPREFHAAKCMGLFDFSIWVDASERMPPEGEESNGIQPWMTDYILDNNGTPEHLERNLHRLMATLAKKR